MVEIKLKKNYAYKFYMGIFVAYYGIVLEQKENWIKIRYTSGFYEGKVAFINLNQVRMLREV